MGSVGVRVRRCGELRWFLDLEVERWFVNWLDFRFREKVKGIRFIKKENWEMEIFGVGW